MGSDSKYYKEIIDKLERLVKKEYALIASLGIQRSLLMGVLVFTFLTLLEMFAHFSSGIRTAIFFSFIILFAGFIFNFFIIPALKYFKIFRRTDYYKTASKVGNHFPDLKDDLLNSMQLVSQEKNEAKYSKSLVDAAFYNVYAKVKSIDFSHVVSFKKAKALLLYSVGTILSCIILLAFVPGLKAATFRLVNYNHEFIPPPKFVFEVEPGNSKVTKGDNLNITVKVHGKISNEVFLAVKNNDETSFTRQQLAADSLGDYHFLMPAVRTSFKYFAASENIKSDVYEIEVIDRPIIKTMDLTVTSPAYSKIPQVQQKDNGNVTALLGSVVELKISSTKNLKKAKIEFSDTTKKELEVAGTQAHGNFIIRKDNDYKIILTDENNNQNLSPINYSIKALYDAYPTIDIIAPNQNTSLANDNRLPLVSKISDDYGFTKLLLHYRLSSSKYEKTQDDFKSIEISINKNVTDEEVSYIWNLSDMNLAAEDVVTYYLEVFDNDYVGGPKSTKSSTFTIRVPSLDEILNKSDNVQNQSEKDLQDTFKEAQELKQKINDISQELKQDKKDISWQEKQKIEQTMDQFKKLQDKVKDISKNLEKMQNNLQQNNLLSKETLQKYMELQKLFDEMSNDEMKKAMEQLKNVLQQLDRKMTQDAMESMKFNEEQFRQTVERTMNLLKRIQIEQKVDDLLKRTDEITKQQNDVQQKTKNMNSPNQQEKNQLSEKQKDITNDLDKYSKDLDDLSKKLDELKDMPKDQLEKMRQEFQKQMNDKLSQNASQQIQQNQMQQAQQNQSQISQNMGDMKKQMQQFQQSISQQSQMQAFKDMMKITDNLITLSKQQEALKNQSQNLDPNSSEFNKNAEQQSNVQRNLDKVMQQMSSLSQKTFAVTPEMGKALGDAQNQMNKSMEGLQNRNSNQAALSQNQAMKSLNEAADMMKNSMEQMMKGGGQGGMMSLMQQLQQMAGQQMNLNNLTQMLQQAMKGQLTMQQQAELQRLGQQQDIIRKSLEQMNKEAMRSGESKKIPADLNQIAQKMEEVVKNMSSNQLDEKTVQEQEHILSRLLDAQRSVNERDYENKRKSEAGKDVVRQSPADLNLDSQNAKNKIRDELNKAVQEGYTKDYENLIRKYYEAIQKENLNN
ncbi:MAG: hypothetical protein M1480_15230 [Bacteroidetes bacterium]|nr:hypothetical protein [Bacteroidota bacterium]